MYLLKKVNSGFEFDKILEEGYHIDEGKNVIKKVQFANGKRKKTMTNYEDCIIKINLGGLDATDIKKYIDNLTDGTFEYFSLNTQSYKRANFLVTKPELTAERVYSTSNYYLDDISILLEKSSDV